MSDVTEAPTQDAIAESLMGEPQEQTTVEEPGVEQQEPVQEEQALEQEQTTEEVAEDWLPTDQDKVFPDEVYARYAQRYQLTPEQAADPLLRQLLHDKINTDIFVRQQQQQAEQFEEPEPEQQQEPTPQQLPSYEQYFQQIDQQIQQRTDPRVAKDFHDGFLRVFGVPEAEIAKATPQQQMALTTHLSKFALNLFNTFAPDVLGSQLPNQLSQAFPGFDKMWERSSYAMAWDQVRNSNPQYEGLPVYGTKEFRQTLRDASSKFPEMMAAFEGPDGKIPPAKAQQAYALLARIATGQTVDPQLIQRAATAQAQNIRRAEVKRAAANLGSGQSKAASGRQNTSRFQTNSDIFDDETMNIWNREHGRI